MWLDRPWFHDFQTSFRYYLSVLDNPTAISPNIIFDNPNFDGLFLRSHRNEVFEDEDYSLCLKMYEEGNTTNFRITML